MSGGLLGLTVEPKSQRSHFDFAVELQPQLFPSEESDQDQRQQVALGVFFALSFGVVPIPAGV